MASDNKKVGIMTFHASYNCGSMLQAFALQKFLKKNGFEPQMIDFSSKGQRRVYSVFSKSRSIKATVRNAIFFLHKKRIANNFRRYEDFKQNNFNLTPYNTDKMSDLKDDYSAVIAGADQIWNITIADYDDAYFLPWVKSKRIAYAPSFGAKNPVEHTDNIEKYKEFLNAFDCLSIRENNGKRWIAELTGRDAPVVLDPTLIIEREDYGEIISSELKLPEKYIFYYSPSFSPEINRFVSRISKKYKLPVIAFNSKSFYTKGMNFKGFKLPSAEDPTTYLQLMQNATMVITTSFHGTVFGSVFERNFWAIKNGGMFGSDDRVMTLVKALDIEDRLILPQFDENFDYMKMPDYTQYDEDLKRLRADSMAYLLKALRDE